MSPFLASPSHFSALDGMAGQEANFSGLIYDFSSLQILATLEIKEGATL